VGNARDSAWIVLAAALALVAHLFIAGAANATAVGSSPFVICSGVAHRTIPDPDSPRDHTRIPDCCVAGCATMAGAAAVPQTPSLPMSAYGRSVAAEAPARVVQVESHERSPINPRGPPAAA
jgi:hypothetical protein